MLRCTIRRELPSMFPVTRKKKKNTRKEHADTQTSTQRDTYRRYTYI